MPKLPIGSRIPGSTLLRDYCAGCGAPIRVVLVLHNNRIVRNYCEQCGDHPNPNKGWMNLTPAQRAGNQKVWAG